MNIRTGARLAQTAATSWLEGPRFCASAPVAPVPIRDGADWSGARPQQIYLPMNDGTVIVQARQMVRVPCPRRPRRILGSRPRSRADCPARCERRPVVRAGGPAWGPWAGQSPTTCTSHCWSGDGQCSNTKAICDRAGLPRTAGKGMGRRQTVPPTHSPFDRGPGALPIWREGARPAGGGKMTPSAERR
jgi:hypothetical protein